MPSEGFPLSPADLATLADLLERGELPPPPACRELARAVRAALAGACRLDEALGLRGGPGERSAATRLAHARRDALLREIHARHFPHLKPSPAAQEIARLWLRYETSAWQRERGDTHCPPRHEGKVYALLWAAMKAGASPLSDTSIRKILVTRYPYS